MFVLPRRGHSRLLAYAVSAALIIGSAATVAEAATPGLAPSLDFTVVAAWVDTSVSPQANDVIVADASGLHRFDSAGWGRVNLPCTDPASVTFGRVGLDGIVPVNCDGTLALYDIKTNAPVPDTPTMVLPSGARYVSANSSLAVYQAPASADPQTMAWYSQRYGEQPVPFVFGTDKPALAGGDLALVGSDGVQAVGFDLTAGTAEADGAVVVSSLTAAGSQVLETNTDAISLDGAAIVGSELVWGASYAVIEATPRSELYLRGLCADSAPMKAQDIQYRDQLVTLTTSGALVQHNDAGVLSYNWYPTTASGCAAAWSGKSVAVDPKHEYATLQFAAALAQDPSSQTVGLPIAKFTDNEGATGLAKLNPDGTLTRLFTYTVIPGTVTISGDAVVGSSLVANVGSWDPADVAFSYQWYAGGQAISGATSTSLTLADAQIGKTITVQVSGRKTGYARGVATSAPTAAVVGVGPAVVITGTASVGQTLTASLTGWPQGVRLSYQWKRGNTVVGIGSSYRVAAGDSGAKLTVTVTGRAWGAAPIVVTSAPVSIPVTVKQFTATPRPTILGWTRVNAALFANPGVWRPVPVQLSYQWSRDGVAIPGATGLTYWPATADRGHRITVAVTGTKAGYASVTMVSAPTAVIR